MTNPTSKSIEEKARSIAEDHLGEGFGVATFEINLVLLGIRAGLEMAAEQDRKLEHLHGASLAGIWHRRSAEIHEEAAQQIEVGK